MTVLQDNLKRLFDKLHNEGVSQRQVCLEVDVSNGAISEFFTRDKQIGPLTLERLSKSSYLQKVSGLDSDTLLCVMTLWYLAANHPLDRLDKHMRMALNILRQAS